MEQRPTGSVSSPVLSARRGARAGFLDTIERVGNRLPDPITIFVGLAALTLAASWLAASSNLAIQHPVTGDPIVVFSLLSREGLQWVFSTIVTNFTGFAPLGTVLVAMIGVGVAERTGLFGALLKTLVTSVPRRAVTPAVVFAGIMSNVASDAGYVILPPVAAMLYASLGRHPLVGIAAAFAGIGGGFSANLLLSTLDPLVADLTKQAAQLYDPTYVTYATANYYFMVASVFVLVATGWFVADRLVEPRFGPWRSADPPSEPGGTTISRLTAQEKRGLWIAGLVFLLTIALMFVLTLPRNAVLRDASTGKLDPFFKSLVGLIMIAFILPGLAYGIATRQVRSDRDAAKMMSQTMAAMGYYIVMAFFAGQFIAWFGKSQLGLIVAIKGAELLKAVGLTGIPLMIAFVAFAACVNLFMSSASAKWAILAPVFVPMLMVLGTSPETTQALYRVGDSVTNIITPLNVYFPFIIAAAQRYVPTAGLGTLIAAMLPFSVSFFVVWTILLIAWTSLGLPVGPGAPLSYPP